MTPLPPPPPLDLPPRDRAVSPRTGLTRAHWEAVADHLLLALRPWASADGARILPPGRLSRSGADSDGFEGYARSFLIAACLIAGRGGEDPHGHAERYAAGLSAGTDPSAPTAWPRPADLPQTKVEAASIVIGLDLTRPWLWERLDPVVRERTLDWLREVIGSWYPDNNWVWFRIVVLTFLRAEDPRLDPRTGDADLVAAWRADLAHDLALHESCAGEGGWFRDGAERAVDHYSTWAFPVFPTLWLRMRGADLLRADGLITPADEHRHRERLRAFTTDALRLIGADGSPLIQGRSLIYRAAAAAPHWAAAMAGLADDDLAGQGAPLAAGRLRRAASGILEHFLAHGVPNGDGLLDHGWHRAFPAMAQDYSGPGSPYWIAMGFIGLALPPDHPVWTAREEPLPVEERSTTLLLPTPGWVLDARREDGIIRVINHGTDHARPGDLRADDPLYARLGYSTATSPPMIGTDPRGPQDQIAAVLDPEHGWSSRTGFETLALRMLDPRTALAASRQRCHGNPPGAEPVLGPELVVASVVRDGIEVRILCAPCEISAPIGVAGWPLSGPTAPVEEADESLVMAREDGTRLRSTLTPLVGRFASRTHRARDVSPLGAHLAAPQLVSTDPLPTGGILVVAVRLDALPGERGAGEPETVGSGTALPAVRAEVDASDGAVRIIWPDGEGSRVVVPG